MSPGWSFVLLAALAVWAGALLFGILALHLLSRRLGRARSWPAMMLIAPLLDLMGTWLGATAAVALLLGRKGFGFAWAGALVLVALMVTASLYDRAVIMPSLDAAFRRLGHGADEERFERDWRFLRRMATWGRAATLVGAAGAIACSVFA